MVMEYLRGRTLASSLMNAGTAGRGPTSSTSCWASARRCAPATRAESFIATSNRPTSSWAKTDTGYEVKVLDFGVSKAPPADDLTREGQILGTPSTSSPEQVEGKSAGKRSVRARRPALRLPHAAPPLRGLQNRACCGRSRPESSRRRASEARTAGGLEASSCGRCTCRPPAVRIGSCARAVAVGVRQPADRRSGRRFISTRSPPARQRRPPRLATNRRRPREAARRIDGVAGCRLGAREDCGPASAGRDTGADGRDQMVAASGGSDVTGLSHSDIEAKARSATRPSRRAGIRSAGASFSRWLPLLARARSWFSDPGATVDWRPRREWPRPRRRASRRPRPRVAAPVPAPVPASVPAPAPTPIPRPAPVEAPGADPAAKLRAEKSDTRKKHATRRHRTPTIDEQGIGIPND